jgi:hypothetical protein
LPAAEAVPTPSAIAASVTAAVSIACFMTNLPEPIVVSVF